MCAGQRPTKCLVSLALHRATGAHTLAPRGGQLLSNAEAISLKEQGWSCEQPEFDDGTLGEFWLCPTCTPRREPK
jgi:hypothetical protein